MPSQSVGRLITWIIDLVVVIKRYFLLLAIIVLSAFSNNMFVAVYSTEWFKKVIPY